MLDQATTWLDEGWGRRRWWVLFTLFTLLGGLWAVATPRFAAPDEPNHAMRAASAAQGQLVGETPPEVAGTGRVAVDVPDYLTGAQVGCFAFHPNQPASCQRFEPTTTIESFVIYVGRYPPLPYLAAGLAARPFPPGYALHVMRLVNVLACAALAASALVTLGGLRHRRVGGLGAALALTPTALFLFGVVNPSGPEIAAAIGTWITGYALVTGEAADTIDRRLLLRFLAAAATLILTRSLGPLWLGTIVAALVVLADRPRLAALARRRDVRFVAGALAAAVVVQGAWIVAADALAFNNPELARSGTFLGFAEHSLGTFWDQGVGQMIGDFGWLDTPAPQGVIALWLGLLGAVVLAGCSATDRRGLAVLLGLVVLTVAVPTIANGMQMAKGFDWQGRYTMPLAVGIPLVAALEWGRRRPAREPAGLRLPVAVAGLLAIAHLTCFWRALQRYAVGVDGRILFWIDPAWSPPGLPPLVLLVAFAAAALAYTGVLLVLAPAAQEAAPAPP